jgi:hypothetical protein
MTTDDRSIIGLARWLRTPPGRYLLAWEQAQLDSHVADVFGFHALQLGLPELDALRANRMPHRWLGAEAVADEPAAAASAAPVGLAARVSVLEEEVAALRAVVEDLWSQLGLSQPGQPEPNDRA